MGESKDETDALYIDAELKDKLKIHAAKMKTSMKAIVEEWIQKYVKD